MFQRSDGSPFPPTYIHWQYNNVASDQFLEDDAMMVYRADDLQTFSEDTEDISKDEKGSFSTMHVLIIVIICLVFIIIAIVVWILVKNRKQAKEVEEVDWYPEYGNEDYDPEYQESVMQDQNDYYDVED